MRLLLAALFVLALAAPAAAQDVVYRPTAGEFTVKVQTAPAGEKAATASVAVVREDTGDQLACSAAGPDEVVDVVVSVPSADLPIVVRGRAFSADACTGDSADSTNTATLELGPPAAPKLVP